MKLRQVLKEDNEWNLLNFCISGTLTGWCHVDVQKQRTRKDWAYQIRYLLEDYFPDAAKIRLVMGNLNTHAIEALYHTFPAKLSLNLVFVPPIKQCYLFNFV